MNERRAFDKVFVNKEHSVDFIKKIDTDFESDLTLTAEEKLKLRILKKELHAYLYKQYEVKVEKDKLFQELRVILERIMNPASHTSAESMYERELEDAIRKIQEFKRCLEA